MSKDNYISEISITSGSHEYATSRKLRINISDSFMTKELYFDFVSEDGSGAVERVISAGNEIHFHYQYSSSDLERDKMMIADKKYNSFLEFWKVFVENKYWFCLHPLFIHPEQRLFIKEKLRSVNWSAVEDEKWREMYQRQWNKVLTAPGTYYKPL